jgi:Helix-turn-helix.
MKNILNKILSEKNISVRKFSKLSDISRSEISRMKNNSKDNISIKTIGKASRALQIDPNIIFPLDNLSKPPIQKEYFNLNNLNYLKEHIDSKKLDFEIHTYKDEL